MAHDPGDECSVAVMVRALWRFGSGATRLGLRPAIRIHQGLGSSGSQGFQGGIRPVDPPCGSTGYNDSRKRAGRSLTGIAGWRKVRTPQGRMLVNGQAQQAARLKATDSGTESKPPKARHRRARQG